MIGIRKKAVQIVHGRMKEVDRYGNRTRSFDLLIAVSIVLLYGKCILYVSMIRGFSM